MDLVGRVASIERGKHTEDSTPGPQFGYKDAKQYGWKVINEG